MAANCSRARVSRFAPGRRLTALAVLLACLLSAPATLRAGVLAAASCPCGFETRPMPLFGGFANFRQVCLFPALCRDTSQIVLVNLLDAAKRPKDCPSGALTVYGDPSLGPAEGSPVAEWRLPDGGAARLLDGPCQCPRCGRKTMHFRQTGFWD